MGTKWVYSYKEAVPLIERRTVTSVLGGKGGNLAVMDNLGIPVPRGFTISTEACNIYLANNNQFPEGMWEQVLEALAQVEQLTGKKFGDPSNPLLVSCRSGAAVSMPGMMDTVLNLGLNAETVGGMIDLTGDARFVYDLYRRLLSMFGSVVLGIPDEDFEGVLESYKREQGKQDDTQLTARDWQFVVHEFKKVYEAHGLEFPQDPLEQLLLTIEAVFKSWNGKRAVDYRNAAGISHHLGTGVSIVTMVYGNMGNDSATGVAFTRNPVTGENKLYGDYLVNAQGEDVVAGIRNTSPISQMVKEMPPVYGDLLATCETLERHYKEMQDVEFTIERGRLWVLQTRDGKRTAQAAVRIAVDMANEGLITREEAVRRVTPRDVDILLHPQFIVDDEEKAAQGGRKFASGVNASPGAAVGRVYFDADTAERMAKQEGQSVIMVRPFTKPDDVHGMLAAKGILTNQGGATSHAAVVARQFGIPCVVGAAEVRIDLSTRQMYVGDTVVKESEWLSVNGTTGDVYLGQIPTIAPELEEQTDLLTLLDWADEIAAEDVRKSHAVGWPQKGLQVWANADYPKDAQRARSYGAKGIGLCRTEHMFFEQERLPIVQRMILAETVEARVAALNELLPLQRADFDGLFRAMDGCPVIIRLIDPPLHEFLPDLESLLEEVVTLKVKGETQELPEKEKLLNSVRALHESNPMMGMRGVRLSVMMPEIVEMQVRAIMEAAADCVLDGVDAKPEVMIPLTSHVNELKFIQPRLESIAKEVMHEKGVEFPYKFGTMVEIPRAALTAGEIAEVAEFFSFGTNDLTQMTYGFSRDDAEGNFLLKYVEDGILPTNPFQTIDRDGVGLLMQICVNTGREARPDLEVGICGEHGGDPDSIDFCHTAGLNYVSCSPFRVPVARLAAAHAALKHDTRRR